MGEQGTGATSPAHMPGTSKGEEIKKRDGEEAGRTDTGSSGADRPAGTRTARDSTSINPDDEEPIDPAMPKMPPA
jgi:hypothetical protein